MVCNVILICQLEREKRICLKVVMSDTVTEVLMAFCVFFAMVPSVVVN